MSQCVFVLRPVHCILQTTVQESLKPYSLRPLAFYPPPLVYVLRGTGSMTTLFRYIYSTFRMRRPVAFQRMQFGPIRYCKVSLLPVLCWENWNYRISVENVRDPQNLILVVISSSISENVKIFRTAFNSG